MSNCKYQEPNKGPFALSASAPTGLQQAMGRAGESGAVSVLVDGACTLKIYYLNILLGSWVTVGGEAANYSKTFDNVGGGLDVFELPPGALFCVTSDVAVNLYHNGDLK